ncbi:MAG: hypothetical protein PHN42_00945 [Bacilli bacterium]|nr:hypothetical protein [Bacilli bacterium]
MIYIVYKMVHECLNNKKYHIRSMFSKRKETTQIDLNLSYLNQIDSYKKIIVENNNIILIIQSGIYFIKITDYSGIITGNQNDLYLIKKDEKGKQMIKNVLINYNKEFIKYQNIIEKQINKYLITKNGCNFNVKYPKDIVILKTGVLYFNIKFLNQNKIYDEQEIDKIYNLLKQM